MIKVIDLCGQELCMNEAAYSFVYPGRPRAFICHAHYLKLLEVAGALGLPTASLDVQRVAVGDVVIVPEGA
jgi:hypothetical protein